MSSVSVSELSRRVGRSRAALLKLAKAGTIPRNLDGTFDEAAVRFAYARNVHPAWRQPLKPAEGEAANMPPDPDSRATIPSDPDSLIRRVLAGEGRSAEGAISHNDVRSAEVILRCRILARDIANHEQEFIAKKPLQRHVGEAFQALRAELAAFPSMYASQIAAMVGCDATLAATALDGVMGVFLEGLAPPADKN